MSTTALPEPCSLSTAAARNLASTTKTQPQMRGVSPRWLLNLLPWIDVEAGTYRLTRTTRRALPRRGSDMPAVVTVAGHTGEPTLPSMFVDYCLPARDYPMSVAQSILRLHTRVDDLYNKPMNQFEQQLRLTIEALRERQEFDLVNNAEFGLLHNAVGRHRISTRSGPPTPSDLDNLISKQTRPRLLFAHPKAIAAFGRECSRRGLSPETTTYEGHKIHSWRGFPIFPCDKLTIDRAGQTSILVMRTGEDRQGVVGLRQTGMPDECQPGVGLRRLGIDQLAITSYLVSIYYSIVMFVPNSVCVLDNVEIGH